MSKVQLIFEASDRSKLEATMKCFCNSKSEIFIEIEEPGFPPVFTCLDEKTAVLFSKHLKREIAILKENKPKTHE